MAVVVPPRVQDHLAVVEHMDQIWIILPAEWARLDLSLLPQIWICIVCGRVSCIVFRANLSSCEESTLSDSARMVADSVVAVLANWPCQGSALSSSALTPLSTLLTACLVAVESVLLVYPGSSCRV